MIRALIEQMLEALEYVVDQGGGPLCEHEAGICFCKENTAIEAAREYLATEPIGERAELIQWLRERGACDGMLQLSEAADMLEADAQPKQVTCQIYGHVVGACVECNTHIEAQQAKPYGWMVKGVPTVMRGSLAQEIQEQEAKRIGGECHAFPVYTTPQQAKRVPMTEKQIDKIYADTARLTQIRTTFFVAFARAIESCINTK